MVRQLVVGARLAELQAAADRFATAAAEAGTLKSASGRVNLAMGRRVIQIPLRICFILK